VKIIAGISGEGRDGWMEREKRRGVREDPNVSANFTCTNYSVSQKNTRAQSFRDNFGEWGPNLIILSLF